MLFTIDREEASRTRIAISSFFITLGVVFFYWATASNLYVNGLVSFTSNINTDFSSFFSIIALSFVILGIGTISTENSPIIEIAHSLKPASRYFFSFFVTATPIIILIGFITYSDKTAFNYLWNVAREVISATSAPFILFCLIGLTMLGALALFNKEYLDSKLSNSFIIFICSIGIISAYYNYHLSNQPLYPWAFRRHIIGFIPLLSAGLALSIESFFSFVSRIETPLTTTLKVTFATILLSSNIMAAEEFRGESNFDGIDDQLFSYSELFPRNSLVIDFAPFSHPSSCSYLTFYTPVDCLILWESPSNNSDWTLLASEIDKLTKNKAVYLLNPSQDEILELGWYLPLSVMQQIDMREINTDVIVWSDHYSSPTFREANKAFSTYKVETSGSQSAYNEINWSSPEPGMHFGFANAIETHNDREFRWSGRESLMRFWGPFESGSYNLTIDLNAWRPDAADDHNLKVHVNGVLIDFIPSVSSIPYHYQIVLSEVTSEVTIALEVNTFKPSDFTSSGDSRELGMRIYGATFQPIQ